MVDTTPAPQERPFEARVKGPERHDQDRRPRESDRERNHHLIRRPEDDGQEKDEEQADAEIAIHGGEYGEAHAGSHGGFAAGTRMSERRVMDVIKWLIVYN
jgi:hypothetical protein